MGLVGLTTIVNASSELAEPPSSASVGAAARGDGEGRDGEDRGERGSSHRSSLGGHVGVSGDVVASVVPSHSLRASVCFGAG